MRRSVGLALAAGASIWAWWALPGTNLIQVLVSFLGAWLVAVSLTAKYTHKYPYRYYSYVVASHLKAAAIQAALLAVVMLVAADASLTGVLLRALGVFLLADAALSLPRQARPLEKPFDPSILRSREVAAQAEPASSPSGSSCTVEVAPEMRFAAVTADLEGDLVEHVRKSVSGIGPDTATLLIRDSNAFLGGAEGERTADLVIARPRVNDVRRINRFFLRCAGSLPIGGHLVCYYEPLDKRRAAMARRFGPFFWAKFLTDFALHRVGPKIPLLNAAYFALTQGRNRAISKAEVWGRLSFCGLKVVAEVDTPAGCMLTAERIAEPVTNRKPSYYPVVALTKVGLDGEMLRTHKVRSMYPFSEFLQKQIFDAHGLVGTGKFKNDFRLTEYGKFLRRHWIDELPQIFDWLRGDIKLVGMRATSPHFLSLYPPDFIRLYVLVKPGLIPPLFDEGTEGFDAIVDIERRYLNAYMRAPWRTDALLLWDTFKAIVFRGVRSK